MLIFVCLLLSVCSPLAIQPLPKPTNPTSANPQPLSNPPPRQPPSKPSTSSKPFQPDLLTSKCPSPVNLNLPQPFSTTITKVPFVAPPPPNANISEWMQRYSIHNNLKTLYYERSYEGTDGQRVVFENKVVVERINKTIPESKELEASGVKAKPYFGNIDPTYFTDWEGLSQAMFEELNLARTQPAKYAEFVRKQLESFDSQGLTYRQGNETTMTTQGRAVWIQAIQFLKKQPPVAPVRRVKCLDCAAAFMVADSSTNAIMAHIDSKFRTTSDRMEITCLNRMGGENIAYGLISARSAITSLIVDDGVPDRGHRYNLYENYTQVGIASGPYELQYRTITVHDFLF